MATQTVPLNHTEPWDGPAGAPVPYLDVYPRDGGPPQRTLLEKLPLTIGRSETADLRLDSSQVSREHAVLLAVDGRVRIRDLGSTNGTFVNGQRVEQSWLAEGDVIHVAGIQLVFHSGLAGKRASAATQVMEGGERQQRHALVCALRRAQERLLHRGVLVQFAPIVNLASQEIAGYAAEEAEQTTACERALLQEESCLAERLLALRRLVAAEQAARMAGRPQVLLPLAASELGQAGLLDSLEMLRRAIPPAQRLVLTLPESAAIDGPYLRRLRDRLAELNIGMAYSGFAAGKKRLAELLVSPPELLLLDASLAPTQWSSRSLSPPELLRTCGEHGVAVVACGIDSRPALQAWIGQGGKLAMGRAVTTPQPPASLTPPPPGAAVRDH
ncbi:MAG: FHA domain-containing protein [Pirellulales bacterium]|nr:FHA domain-containing protein [Pirellulales bacterium]